MNAMDTPARDLELSPEELAEAQRREALWARAAEIVRQNPGLDTGDVFHALQCLALSPAERLRLSFQRGRLRAYAR